MPNKLLITQYPIFQVPNGSVDTIINTEYQYWFIVHSEAEAIYWVW